VREIARAKPISADYGHPLGQVPITKSYDTAPPGCAEKPATWQRAERTGGKYKIGRAVTNSHLPARAPINTEAVSSG
jgi:hypothetical protein